jgi:hypothetical protein
MVKKQEFDSSRLQVLYSLRQVGRQRFYTSTLTRFDPFFHNQSRYGIMAIMLPLEGSDRGSIPRTLTNENFVG